MGEHRTSRIERIVHRIEEHIEDWRRREAARAAEVEANRDHLWAEAAERERLLAEAMGKEEARRGSIEEIAREQRVVFVMHSEEVARALEEFAGEGERLVKVVPRRGGSYTAAPGIKGSWLVFETSE
jgi:hypothetical protein